MKTGVLVSAASFAFTLLSAPSANAADDPVVEWDKRQGVEERLRSYGPDLLGDQIDPHSGAIVFEHTDVSLPGNSALEVAVRRRRGQGLIYHESVDVEFGDWELMVPRIHALSGNGDWTGNRCSNNYATSFPLVALGGGNFYQGNEYSEGVVMDVPGAGAQQVLEGKQGAQWPSAATHVTTENWWLECTTASDGGQGFIAHAPNGNVYKFDKYITVLAKALGTWGSTQLNRKRNILAASEVTDVHGNWVKYDYDVNGRLTKIHSNDGRVIDLAYSGSSKLISSVTANGRTWTYGYGATDYSEPFEIGNFQTSHTVDVLRTVTQPDGRAWSFDLDDMIARAGAGTQCVQLPRTLTVTHPYGMVGTFNLAERVHRQSDNAMAQIKLECPNDPDIIYNGQPPTNLVVTTFETMSVTSKSLSGPKISSATWTYTYEQDPSAAGVDPGVELSTNWTTVQDPSGAHIKYYHYWNAKPNGGKLYKREVRQDNASGALLESTKHTYNVDNASPTPPMENPVGSTYIYAGPMPQTTVRPSRLYETRIGRNGEWYKTRHEYDSNYASSTYSFGAPITTWEWSSTSGVWAGRRTTETEYINRKPVWVLPLTKKITRNGKVFEEHSYDSAGRRQWTDRFGTRWRTYTYHTTGVAAGLVKTAKDVLNRTTSLNNYKRGEPQTITRPDGISTYSVVDNNGWRTSETDANSTTINYQYNNMGWLTLIDRPAPWADTDIFYGNVGTNTYQRSTRGAHRVVTWYDAFMRPWKVRNQPMSGGGLTSYVRTEYDVHGRETFVSFPSTLTTPTDGADTTYDALGRPVEVKENVAPNATTTTQYLSLARTRTTDPEGNITTITTQGYGAPDDGGVIKIEQPTDVTTDITRDIYGNMLTANQYGAHNGYSVSKTQRWYYDDRLRLCRHRIKETGDTLFQYDDANQLTATADGQPEGSGCALPPVAQRTVRLYDTLGRVTNIDYPSGTPDVTITYDDNGNVTRNQRGIADWRYAYDDLNQLQQEKLHIDGYIFKTNYFRDAQGVVESQETPYGRTIAYTPNGVGQAKEASSGGVDYASSVDYHPDGSLRDLTYGNGNILTQLQNARQLVYEIKVRDGGTKLVELTYAHDNNGRIETITDGVVSGQNRTFTYDGLGRLATAAGPWGAGTYTYDSLGNLREKTLGSRTVFIYYDNALNRVSQVRDYPAEGWKYYSYDNKGNVADNDDVTFTYDAANQPTTMGGVVTATYVYDGNLKRAKQTVDGETIYSIYGQSGALLYRHNATTGEVTDYIRVAGKTVARLKTISGSTTASYPHQDHLGSPVAATSTTGAVLWREDYTPYGEERQDPAANDNDENFTGHIRDDATGLIYAQARYMDPVIGRFLSNDPVGFSPGAPQMFNRYSYTLNDPVNAIDPDGRVTICNNHSGGGTSCMTVATSATAPKGSSAVVANNVNDSNRRSYTATGSAALDQAASEVAGELNQKKGNERVFRMDQASIAGADVVFTSEIDTVNSSPSGAEFRPQDVAGADAVFHTEPKNSNTGVPGPGDGSTVDATSTPNYQAYGKDVNAVEVKNGAFQVRPVNHKASVKERGEYRSRANDYQRDKG